jgi:hypothetical protein
MVRSRNLFIAPPAGKPSKKSKDSNINKNLLPGSKPSVYDGSIIKDNSGGNKTVKVPNKAMSYIDAFGNVVSAAAQVYDHLEPILERKRKFEGSKSNDGGRKDKAPKSYALSNAPDPLLVELRTGIKPQAYTNDYMDAIEGRCSPLHMTGAIFQFPANAALKLKDYFDRVIAFDLQVKAQANVSFNLNISDKFTSENILTAMNDLVYALQLYLYNQSIISYSSDSRNKNAGMIYMRTFITSEILEEQYLLGRLLADMPIPPNLLQLIRYLSANFLSGDNQGAAIIKTYPTSYSSATRESCVTTANELRLATASLSTNVNKEIFSLMRRAIPQWIPGPIKDVPTTCVYDKDYLTIFSNLPFGVDPGIGTPAQTRFPQVSTDDQEIPYNSFTNDLDGVAFSLTSAFFPVLDDPNKIARPGLMIPVPASGTNTGNTRISYYEVDGVENFYPSKDYRFLLRSRQDTVQLSDDGTEVYTPHLYGCDRVLGVCINSIRVTSQEAVDYLMSLSTIMKTTSNSIRRPRSRG